MKQLCRAAAPLLAALILLLLPACGETGPSPQAGTYVCAGVENRGLRLDPEELFPQGVRLQLDSGGGGKLIVNGEEGLLKWSLNGEDLLLNMGGRDYRAALADDLITLTLPDSGLTLRLVREGAALPGDEMADLSPWLGDWYGWWRIENSQGKLPDSWYDCFATVEADDQGGLSLTIWDEETTRSQPLGSVSLRVRDDTAVSTEGWFWFDDIGEEDWSLRIEENTLRLSACHEAGGERFDYTILLRPWGALWDDMEEENLPYYYEDWYLPLIDQGEAMPDAFDPHDYPILP